MHEVFTKYMAILQCCGARVGAARSRIIFVEPDPQRDAARAPNLMFNIDGIVKISESVTVFLLFLFPFITI
jgi:hypothetical protein